MSNTYCFTDSEIDTLNLSEQQKANFDSQKYSNPNILTSRKKCITDLNSLELKPSQAVKLPDRTTNEYSIISGGKYRRKSRIQKTAKKAKKAKKSKKTARRRRK